MDSKWVKTKILGKGSYGTVSLAKPGIHPPGYSICDRSSAVKSADIYRSSSLVMEGRIMYQLDGCHQIVRCFGEDVSVEKGQIIYNLLLEYAPGGTLADIINARGNTIPEYEASMYAYMLLLGLSRIHQEGFTHCDLKPANILVFPRRKDGILVNRLKITDFGLVKKSDCPGGVISKHGPLYKLRGTPQYSSPESVLMGINEPPMDIWSLGCILIEIISGKRAYTGSNMDSLLGQIASKDYVPEMPTFLSEKGRDFLMQCLKRNHQNRPTADMLLKHPFIVDNYNKLYSEHKDLMSWVEDPICYNPWWTVNDPNCPNRWWSGKSAFSTSLSPMASCFPANHVAAAAAGCALIPPRYICSTNNVRAAGLYAHFPPQHIISRNNVAAAGLYV